MNSNEKTSIQYWKLIRVGKAKKVLEELMAEGTNPDDLRAIPD